MIEISSFRTCVVNFGFDGFFYKCTCIELGSIGTAATCLFSRILSVKFNECVKCLCPSILELITFEILAAERLRLMEFDNRLIIDCFANVVNILIWQFSTNDRFKSEKYESLLGKSISRNELY